ncbi:MAG: hypothetical protein JRC86_12665 [Deltaproteobacteria bacterium]|nr:hypothetical protein [Deltaproteobacteria bacterium]
MNEKPKVEKVLAIMGMKKRAAELHESIDRAVKAALDEFGPGRFDYALADVNPLYLAALGADKRQFLKFETIDNVWMLNAGGTVWKSVPLKHWPCQSTLTRFHSDGSCTWSHRRSWRGDPAY